MWVVIHFEGIVGEEDGRWLVDYVQNDRQAAYEAYLEFNEADPSIEYYVGEVLQMNERS